MKYISAYPEKVYGGGGYYDQEVPLETIFPLNLLQPSPVSFFGKLFESEQYRRPTPKLYGADETFVRGLSGRLAHVGEKFATVPGSILICVENCFIHKNVIYRPAMDGLDVLHETYRENDRPWTTALDFSNSTPQVNDNFDSVDAAIYLGSVGSQNYGHFLVDDLARVKAVSLLSSTVTIVIPSYGKAIDSIRKQALDAMLPPNSVRELLTIKPDEVQHFDRLFYPTPVSYHPVIKSPSALNYIRSTLDSGLNLGETHERAGGRRLFVTRNTERYRRVINLSEVEALLAADGFETIDPEKLTFEEQVRAFAEADVVAGIMCAAMTNTVFCRRGINVIYFAPSGWSEPFYWDLAGALGHEYTVVFGPLKQPGDPVFADFHIDLGLVRKVLRDCCRDSA